MVPLCRVENFFLQCACVWELPVPALEQLALAVTLLLVKTPDTLSRARCPKRPEGTIMCGIAFSLSRTWQILAPLLSPLA